MLEFSAMSKLDKFKKKLDSQKSFEATPNNQEDNSSYTLDNEPLQSETDLNQNLRDKFSRQSIANYLNQNQQNDNGQAYEDHFGNLDRLMGDVVNMCDTKKNADSQHAKDDTKSTLNIQQENII